jgi:hypothetical protein
MVAADCEDSLWALGDMTDTVSQRLPAAEG